MPGANYRDWIVGRQVACSARADLNSRAARGAGPTGRPAMRLVTRITVLWLAALLIVPLILPPAHAANQPSFAPEPAKPKAETAPPSEIQKLLNLLVDPKEQAWLQQLLNALADPKVQAWLQQQNKTEAVAPAPAAESTEEMMSTRVEAVRERIAEMVGAIPGMPAEFDNAGEEHKESGIILDLTRCGPARE